MLPFREVKYVNPTPTNANCFLAADIGGTNGNFGVFQLVHGDLKMILALHVKTQEITNFADTVHNILQYLSKTYDITISKACIGAAGIISRQKDNVKPTNLNFEISLSELYKKTSITSCLLVNDFEIVGYGLKRIDPKNLVKVKKGIEWPNGPKAILGAGTGLGKCVMLWDQQTARYRPYASEGGHADFPVQDQLELDLVRFIQAQEQFNCNISWENVLNGNGIERIYRFFYNRDKHHSVEHVPHPDEIFSSRKVDDHSMKTFELYTKIYARCAKDYALDVLAHGGVYIAGGIAAKNLPLFELPIFHNEFINCGKQQKFLADVPVYVITDYNVSLYGAAEYMLLQGMCD